MLASQVLIRKAREGISRDSASQNGMKKKRGGKKKKTNNKHPYTHKPPNTTSCCFAEEGQREGGVFDTLLHPHISGCYCTAAGCRIW